MVSRVYERGFAVTKYFSAAQSRENRAKNQLVYNCTRPG
jgi:hypothetical protein